MSSIIVLDSSDEDETPTKRSARSIPATITAVKTSSLTENPMSLFKPPTKPRAIPSGITVTRRSPVMGDNTSTTGASGGGGGGAGDPVLAQALAILAKQKPPTSSASLYQAQSQSSPLAISNSLMEHALANIGKPQLHSLPKINAAFSLNSVGAGGERRQTPTPPKSQLPQLQPSPHVRKRKTPTPPQQRKVHTPPTAVATSPGLLPMICAVQSLTAGATPPQQLMATPPHSAAAAMIAYNEHQQQQQQQQQQKQQQKQQQQHQQQQHQQQQQLMINPHLIHSHLPASTTITAQPLSTLNHGAGQSSSNGNNSFKIQLPPKPRTPATVTSNTPSPASSPVQRTPRQMSSPSPTNNKYANYSHPSHHIQQQQPPPPSPLPEKTQRRIKPTTLMKHSDEAWLQQRQRTMITFNDDISMEVLHSTSSPSPKAAAATAAAASTTTTTAAAPLTPKAVGQLEAQDITVTLSSKPRTPPTSTQSNVQALKAFRHTPAASSSSSVVLDLTSPELAKSRRAAAAAALGASSAILDLTGSPEKFNKTKLNGETPTSTLVMEPISVDSSQETNKDESLASTTTGDAEDATDASTSAAAEDTLPRPPLESDYAELIKACREADSSRDMEKLINTKLIRYYYGVHPDFVRSRGFRKNVRAVVERIRADPELVYYNLKTIVEELKVRRKCKEVVVNNEEASGSTGNKRTDEQIKKLNKALYMLTKRIEALEQAEVDWEEEDSSYLQVERFKKRACQIYEKICDLTGESKNAHRLVKKPIQFNATTLPQFNKTLQAYINRTKEFPDYFDVLHMLEHCNRQYAMGLVNFEMKRIAHDAFIKVGKLLQSRRKTDLYETVTHFTANAKDPASSDPTLLAKLSENQKHQTKIGEIIEKFAREQDLSAEEQKEARLQEKLKSSETTQKEENGADGADGADEDDDDDDDDEEDEENANDLEADVEKLANGDLSDAESDAEADSREAVLTTNATNKPAQKLDTEKPTIVTAAAGGVAAAAAAAAVDKPIVVTPDNLDKIVNNNLARAKTVGDTSSSSSALPLPPEQHKQIPNGKAKADDGSSNATPSLKISSVSSLCENAVVGVSSSNSNKSDSSRRATPPATAPPRAAKPQRTVAEIVISDEEEDGGSNGRSSAAAAAAAQS